MPFLACDKSVWEKAELVRRGVEAQGGGDLNLPNKITAGRLVLTGGFIITAEMGGFWGYLAALGLFIAASISDWLDGYLARKMGLVTSLGKLMDPLADKILVTSAFVVLVALGLCPVWVCAVIIGREFLVTGLRQIALEKKVVMAADGIGKWKTGFQMAYAITSLVWLMLEEVEGGLPTVLEWFRTLASPEGFLFPVFLWGALLLTVLSGLHYLRKSWEFLRD